MGAARWALASGLALQLAAGAASADEAQAGAQIAALPPRGAAVAAFVPSGWVIERRLEADLDRDKSHDAVLVLLQDERTAGDRQRALVVLLQRAEGFVLGGRNFGLLPFLGGAGVKGGDGAPELKVDRGVLVVEQSGGSREFYSSTSRFRWNRARGCFELIGEDTSSGDSLDHSVSSTSCNLLTRRCETTVMSPEFDSEGNEIPTRTTVTRYRLPRQPLPTLEKPDFVSK